MKLKNRIKVICAEKELKLGEVADHLNISASSFSKIVNNKQITDVKTALLLARYLEKSFDEVFYLEE